MKGRCKDFYYKEICDRCISFFPTDFTKRERKKRASKHKPSSEQMKRFNSREKCRKNARIAGANFDKGDFFIGLSHKSITEEADIEAFAGLRSKLFRAVRDKCNRLAVPLFWLCCIEVGEQKKHLHMHVLINKEAANILIEQWERLGGNYPDCRAIKDSYEAHNVGSYISKSEQKPDAYINGHKLRTVTHSKNLIIPEPEVSIIPVKDVNYNEPQAPDGYYVIPDSVEIYENPYTGYTYQRYTCRKIKSSKERDEIYSRRARASIYKQASINQPVNIIPPVTACIAYLISL